MKTLKFTHAAIERAPVGTYHVEGKPGLYLIVRESGDRTFRLTKKLKHQRTTVTVTLGKLNQLPIKRPSHDYRGDCIEDLYHEAVSCCLRGENPNARRRREQVIALGQAFDNYMRDIPLAESTRTAYRQINRDYFAGWKDTPLTEIDDEAVRGWYRRIASDTPYTANKSAALFGAVWRHATGDWAVPPACPTRSLRRLRHKERRRTGYVQPGDLQAWWDATGSVDATYRDYFRFVLLTGLRRQEAAGLSWDDYSHDVIRITETKNKDPHTLPLSDYLVDLLESRRGEDKPFDVKDPRLAIEAVRKASGVQFTIHDLRRSFASYCEALDFGYVTIKRLMNHRTSDVTSGYVQLSTEGLRVKMQQVTDFVLSHAGVKDNVIPMRGQL